MSGLMSRRKGTRAEYKIRDHLRSLGYETYRVPLSGASEGFKCDVVARKGGITYTLEVKSRRSAFRTIYKFFRARKDSSESTRILYPNGTLIAVSTSFEQCKETGPSAVFTPMNGFEKWEVRACVSLLRHHQWLQGAQYLVIIDNNQPPLYIRYWI